MVDGAFARRRWGWLAGVALGVSAYGHSLSTTHPSYTMVDGAFGGRRWGWLAGVAARGQRLWALPVYNTPLLHHGGWCLCQAALGVAVTAMFGERSFSFNAPEK